MLGRKTVSLRKTAFSRGRQFTGSFDEDREIYTGEPEELYTVRELQVDRGVARRCTTALSSAL